MNVIFAKVITITKPVLLFKQRLANRNMHIFLLSFPQEFFRLLLNFKFYFLNDNF